MIAYKWVIKEDNKYYPIINNGAYRLFNNLDLGYYKKRNTIKEFINPYNLIRNGFKYRQFSFHRTGFHFWINNDKKYLNNYQRVMKFHKNKKINCILKCYVRKKDIILENEERLIANKFRILGEIK
jgi:hypothetical protein